MAAPEPPETGVPTGPRSCQELSAVAIVPMPDPGGPMESCVPKDQKVEAWDWPVSAVVHTPQVQLQDLGEVLEKD